MISVTHPELDPKNLFPRDAVSMEMYKKLWDAATDRLTACICGDEVIALMEAVDQHIGEDHAKFPRSLETSLTNLARAILGEQDG